MEDLECLRDVEQVLLLRREYTRQSSESISMSEHRPSGSEAPGTPPCMGVRPGRRARGVEPGAGPPAKSILTVRAWFMTHVSSEEAPCRPNGTTFHSNWPSCDRNLVFHRSATRTRSW